MQAEESFNLIVRRMLRSSRQHSVISVAYSSFNFFKRNQQSYQLTVNFVRDTVKYYGGVVYDMSSGDQFIVFVDPKDAVIEDVMERVAGAAFPGQEVGAVQESGFLHLYRIPEQYVELRQAIDQYIKGVAGERGSLVSYVPYHDEINLKECAGPLCAKFLAAIEGELADIKVVGYIRRQPVCEATGAAAAGANPAWREIYSEMFISIGELKADYFPNVVLPPQTPLFHEFCRQLDYYSIPHILTEEHCRPGQRIGFNASVQSLQGPLFDFCQKFMHNRPPKSVVVELNYAEMFLYPQVFQKTITSVREAGMAVALDGITLDVVPLINVSLIDVDYYKIIIARPHLPLLRDMSCVSALHRIPRDRVIICRCDLDQFVTIGQTFGITRYQGRLIQDFTAA